MKEEEVAFLDSEHELPAEHSRQERLRTLKRIPPFESQRRARPWGLWCHVTVFVLYCVVWYGSWKYQERRYSHGPGTVWTPARESISYVRHPYIQKPGGYSSKYFGDPSDALEDAWEELLAPMHSWFTKEEVARFGEVKGDPVILPDGRNMGGLFVYHNLHCIKRLYRAFHRDEFFHNLTETEEELLHIHNMHCLDFLREAVMCQADPTPLIYKWDDLQSVPIGDTDHDHECVNWDNFHDWAMSRRVDPYKPGEVIHPKFGPAYANMKENQVGAVFINKTEEFDSHES